MTARHLKFKGFAQLALSRSMLSVLLLKVTNFLVQLFELVFCILNLLEGLFYSVACSGAVVLELGEHLTLVCGF